MPTTEYLSKNLSKYNTSADRTIYGPYSQEMRFALLHYLVADLIVAGELKPTAGELARWAAANEIGFVQDSLSAMAEVLLKHPVVKRSYGKRSN